MPEKRYSSTAILFQFEKANRGWFNMTGCRISKFLCPAVNSERTRELLELDTLIRIPIQDGPIGNIADKFGVFHGDNCRGYHDVKKTKSVQYLLCECNIHLNRHHQVSDDRKFEEDLGKMANVSLRELGGFMQRFKPIKHGDISHTGQHNGSYGPPSELV